MNWLKEVLGTEKPIIAMCHFQPMPGDPNFDEKKGMDFVVERAREDFRALQDGGVDAVMFSNEFSLPYLTKVRTETVAAMARVIGELKAEIQIPFGVNVIWDPCRSLDLAAATGALFIREIISGVYASDFGLWNTSAGETARHRRALGLSHVKLLYNIVPEASVYLGGRDIQSITKTTIFNCAPDALCVSGLYAGADTNIDTLKKVREAAPDTVIFSNTGVNSETVKEHFAISDGAVVGTTFKYDRKFENGVEAERVKEFMKVVKSLR